MRKVKGSPFRGWRGNRLLNPYVPASAVIVHTTFRGGGLGGSLMVHRVACVVDCGVAVDPGSIEGQRIRTLPFFPGATMGAR